MDIVWLNKTPVMNLRKGLSFRRRLNALLAGWEFRRRASRLRSYPAHLIVDLINVCGLKCPICPQGRNEIPRKPERISAELFKSIIDTLGPYLYTLTLTNWGEPLRHPNLIELLRYARKSPAYIGFSSNLQYLPDELIDPLLRTGIDEIGCSIDGVTEETYKKYRVGGDFHLAVSNMKKLVDHRNALGLKTPRIRWQVLLHRHTEPEISAIIDKAEELGVDSLVFLPIFLDISRMTTASPQERLARDRDWLPKDSDLSWYDYQTGRLKNEPKICSKLWNSAVIHPDGAVSPCCLVTDPKDDFGRMNNADDFMRIWNGERYRESRRRWSGERREPLDTVCEQCRTHGVMIL